MKKILSIAFLFCLAVLFVRAYSYSAGSDKFSVNDLAKAIDDGNADKLAAFVGGRVEITIHQKTCSYSRNQAEAVLRSFFNEQKVDAFRMLSTSSNDVAEVYTGMLNTRQGNFKTTIYLKLQTDPPVLQEIRFEETD